MQYLAQLRSVRRGWQLFLVWEVVQSDHPRHFQRALDSRIVLKSLIHAERNTSILTQTKPGAVDLGHRATGSSVFPELVCSCSFPTTPLHVQPMHSPFSPFWGLCLLRTHVATSRPVAGSSAASSRAGAGLRRGDGQSFVGSHHSGAVPAEDASPWAMVAAGRHPSL
eukprot:scaffold504_cov240-Pinguiococcus_pyrenoidosus.AAC.2